MSSIVYNTDCLEGMKQYPDKYFDLAVVDPPYGIGYDETTMARKGRKMDFGKAGGRVMNKYKGTPAWDFAPQDEYFNELKRVSENQIIWGYNHLANLIGPCSNFIFWDKHQPVKNFADGELAYTSFKGVARKFSYAYYGNINSEPNRSHPTQKPVKLYDWIYKNYLPNGGKVLDTHLGSGSNRIAADKAGNIDFTAFEIDKDYFESSEKRFANYKQQLVLF